jgi:formiminotetrahydrofolate cyclodeaminase
MEIIQTTGRHAIVDADDFLARLSSPDPVPGGGSVAALQVAMGAALLVMVANLTLGRKRFAAVEDQVASIRGRAERLRDRAAELVDEDIQAYGRVAAAMTLSRDDEDQKASRRTAIQDALKEAASPPLATMRAAAEVLDLARALVSIGNPSAVSDVGTAAVAARAGYEAARLNVEINVAGVTDQEWCAARRTDLAAMPDVESIASDVVAASETVIRGGT